MAHPCSAPFWHYRRSLSLDQSRDKVIVRKDPLHCSAKGYGESNLARKTTGGKGSGGKSVTRTESEARSDTPPPDLTDTHRKSEAEQDSEQPQTPKNDVSLAVSDSDEGPLEKATRRDADAQETAPSRLDQQGELPGAHEEADRRLASTLTDAETVANPQQVPKEETERHEGPPEVDAAGGTYAQRDQECLPAETATEADSEKTDATESHENSDGTELASEKSSSTDHSEHDGLVSDSVTPPLHATTHQKERRGGFFPLLFGGVAAGAIGYGAHYLTQENGADEIAALRDEISQIRADLRTETPAPDLSAIEAELGALQAQIAELETADRPMGEIDTEALLEQLRADIATVAPSDLSPLQDRLDSIEQTLSSQTDAVAGAENRLSTLEADLVDLRDLSERRVAEAEAAIDLALARSGLESVRAALQTGAPYADALTRLREAEVAVPDALANPAAGGVATVDSLQEQFPTAARSALRVALQDEPADSMVDRFQNFIRAQIGARSTVPREGDDPDAILSRAAAHVEAENIDAALIEIEALPASAQQAMQPWLDQAKARVAAEAALPDLTNAITTE